MSSFTPHELDEKLVKAIIKALRRTKDSLTKLQDLTNKERVGIWCNHLRGELFQFSDSSRQFAEIIRQITKPSQWDAEGFVRRHYWRKEKVEPYSGKCLRPSSLESQNWICKAHTEQGIWTMTNSRLNELVNKAKKSPDYMTILENKTEEIKTGIKEVECELQCMFNLLEEFDHLNTDADQVVSKLCQVAEEMLN